MRLIKVIPPQRTSHYKRFHRYETRVQLPRITLGNSSSWLFPAVVFVVLCSFLVQQNTECYKYNIVKQHLKSLSNSTACVPRLWLPLNSPTVQMLVSLLQCSGGVHPILKAPSPCSNPEVIPNFKYARCFQFKYTVVLCFLPRRDITCG